MSRKLARTPSAASARFAAAEPGSSSGRHVAVWPTAIEDEQDARASQRQPERHISPRIVLDDSVLARVESTIESKGRELGN
jgi:hypothetical protein